LYSRVEPGTPPGMPDLDIQAHGFTQKLASTAMLFLGYPVNLIQEFFWQRNHHFDRHRNLFNGAEYAYII
jgi:hypothetical protein